MQIEKEDRHMSRVMRITRAPCQRYVLNSQEKKKENKKVVQLHHESTRFLSDGWLFHIRWFSCKKHH